MTQTEELGVVIKVMHLLRIGKIDASTTNINVMRLLHNDKDRVHDGKRASRA